MKYPPSSPFEGAYDKALEDGLDPDAFAGTSPVPGSRHAIDFNNLRNAPTKKTSHLFVLLSVLLLIGAGYMLSFLFVGFTRYGSGHQANVILMISDGMGPASETFARSYIQYLHDSDHPLARAGARWEFPAGFGGKLGIGKGGFGMLPLDALLVGQSRTRSSNSLVSDSSAGATAFSCGLKTYNGGVAIEPVEREPCGTVLEAAKHKGYLTGLVTTSRLTHATPAAFYSHVVDRDMETEIADQLVATHPLHLSVDYALGGGRCFFLPNSTEGSCRQDDIDPFSDAPQYDRKSNAIRPKMLTTRQEFDALANDSTALGTVGLFSLDHMAYDIDRLRQEPAARQPSLKEMAAKAMSTLSAAAASRKANGFFLMIEGARIDMAAHSNDPIAHLGDILAYQETVREVKRFTEAQNKNGWPTLMISVSDHETGGLSLGKQLNPDVYPEYLWFPDALVNASISTLSLAEKMASSLPASETQVQAWLGELGIGDPSEDEVRTIQEQSTQWALDRLLSDMVSRRAQVGWSTHGHSGVDVSLYAYGHQAEKLKGNVENTDIGEFIAKVLAIDLQTVTDLLRRTSKAWHSKESTAAPAVGVQHFHGMDALSSGGGSSHLYLGQDADH